MGELSVVGKAIPRLDAAEKVTGQMVYAADLGFGGMLHGKILRCPFAHARIVAIDTSRARALPGVEAVVTAADLPPAHRDPSIRAHVVFAENEVVFHGEAVAAVAAISTDVAEEAIELIEVVYEELPAVLDLEQAVLPGTPLTRLPLGAINRDEEAGHLTVDLTDVQQSRSQRSPNITNRLRFRRGDAERGLSDAAYLVTGRFDAAMVHQAYLEPQVTIADFDPNGHLTIHAPTQAQFLQRAEIAHILGLDQSHVHYRSTEMGGAFGGKVAPLVQPVAALLSMKTGRPVKIVLTRREDLAVAVPAPRIVSDVTLGARADGTISTIKATITVDAGAYPSGPVVGAAMMIASCYRYEHLDVEGIEVITNKVSCGAYRAPGVPEVAIAVEQLVDELAERVGMDPLAFRKLNAVVEGDLLANNRAWPRLGLQECLDSIEQTSLWRNKTGSANGKRRGVGLALGAWLGGMQPAGSLVRLNENGTVNVIVGVNDMTGTLTAFAQIAAEVLAVPIDRVECWTGDTDTAPYAGMTAGSKTMYAAGRSVLSAARDARLQIAQIAAEELGTEIEDLAFTDGVVFVPGTEKRLTFAQIAGFSSAFGARYAPVMGVGRDVVRSNAPSATVQAVEVEVDEATGEVTVLRIAAVQDVGKAINPLAVEGQLEGGVIQGIGMGLTEAMEYDGAGRMRNPTFLDYRLVTAMDAPPIESVIVEVPSPEGAFGARICGEPSIIPGAAALANAIANAIGVRLYQTPFTPERIVAALERQTLTREATVRA